MSRCVCHVATDADAGQRIDVVLANRQIFPSRSAAARALEGGCVQVFGKVVNKRYNVCAGDAIVCEIADAQAAAASVIEGQDIPLDIRFEDEHLAVISKQAGLLVHPSREHTDGTLVNALVYRYGAAGLCNVQGEDDRPGIVHRLDGDTSGLMIVAKTDEAGAALMEAIRLRQIDRHYVTLVHGVLAPDTAMIDAPIARHPTDRMRMAVADTSGARDAVTTLKVLERFESDRYDNGYTLVECKLFTGRTHQIRVHMQYTKHPVVGDPIYTSCAPKDARAQMGLTRQFLHSYSLAFDHPVTGERLEFTDGLAPELWAVLDTLEQRSTGQTEVGREVLACMRAATQPSCQRREF
jgi:23S rRNA pseudouridine1911/1915/1917 synthase